MFYIRRSQFIRVYGPGAIYEDREAPYVILSLEAAEGFDFSTYRIDDPILSSYLKSLPSSHYDGTYEPVALELPYSSQEQNVIFLKARIFQRWYLCPEHGYLWEDQEEEGNTFCPECGNYNTSMQNSRPVRFIMVCNRGHMDDLEWDKLVHRYGRNGRRDCGSKIFEWKGEDNSVIIKCRECGAEITLFELYGLSSKGVIKCTGRFPEKESDNQRCNESAKIVLRMASNVRIPEVLSLLMVWPRSNELEQILSSNEFYGMLGRLYQVLKKLEKSNEEESEEERYNRIKGEVEEILKQELSDNQGRIVRIQEYDLLKANIEELYRIREFKMTVEKIYSFRRGGLTYSPKEILDMELEYLKRTAKQGALEGGLVTGRKYLEVNPNKTLKTETESFLIAPLDTLTVLEVQVGYRRYDPDNGEIVSVGARRPNDRHVYYPAIKLTGEGIFLYLSNINLRGKSADTWWRAYKTVKEGQSSNYRDSVFRLKEEKYELHPVFVFLHTLSHLFVKAISMYAGYPMASLRERVYLHIGDANTNNVEGGIVIYTATEDEGGAMGGLVSLVRKDSLKQIFEIVIHMANYCSNDPVCKDYRFELGKVAGASCYACTILPETSCEYRNLWLDRHIVMENEDIIREVTDVL